MSTESQIANAEGLPVVKVTDMGVPPPPPPANDTESVKPVTEEPPEGGEAPKVEEPKAEPEKTDKLAKARAAASKANRVWQERNALQAEAQRRHQEAQRYNQIAQAEAQRSQALQRELDALRDPTQALAHLEKVGLDAKTLTERALQLGSPEAKLRAELEEVVNARVSAVEQRYEAELKRIHGEREASQRAQAERAAHQQFLAEASDAEHFPAVAHILSQGEEWGPSLIAEAMRVLEQAYQKNGQQYTNREVLAYLDDKYAKIVSPSSKPKDGASRSNGGLDPKKDTNGSGTAETKEAGAPRTLTNKMTQQKGTLPADYDNLPPAEQKAALAALYRQLSRG